MHDPVANLLLLALIACSGAGVITAVALLSTMFPRRRPNDDHPR